MKVGDFLIKESFLKFQSYLGITVNNLFLTNSEKSKRLVVLFPGKSYKCDAPLFHYARKATIALRYDVLSLEYGFQTAGTDFQREDFPYLLRDTLKIIDQCLKNDYLDIFFISKSLGTKVAGELSKNLDFHLIKHIFFTPLPAVIPHILSSQSIVFVGTEDPYFKKIHIEKINRCRTLDLRIIKGANHSLEVEGDYQTSLAILRDVIDASVDFVSDFRDLKM